MFTRIIAASTIGVLTASTAMAAVSANAVTDLNLRAAPDARSEVIGVIPNNAEVSVEQCFGEGEWCEVNFEGTQGYAYSPYLMAPLNGEPAPIYESRSALEIETVTVEDEGAKENGALGGSAMGGIIAGALIGGPVGVAAGMAAGAVAGGELVPQEKTVTYVRENPVEPVYLDGEVVVGAGIPQDVQVVEVPESEYSYLYVNGVPAIVDGERQIVQVVR